MQVRLLKKAIRSIALRLGYGIVPIGSAAEYQRVRDELSHCQIMRDIHRQDTVEIEELYRTYLFADLPRRSGRAQDLGDLIGTTVSEAIYVIKHLHDSLKIPGDICEFGVAEGATSKLLASEIMDYADRKLWLFDSFEGLPAPTNEDKLIHDIFKLRTIEKYQGTMAFPEGEVLKKLASINFPPDRIKIKKGWVKDTIRTANLPARVAFAYIDFDFYEPIKEALEFLDSRMALGGRIVVDDYGFFSEGAQVAVDRFVTGAGGRWTFELPLSFAGHFCILGKVA
jgi:hypothetical protein